MHILSIIITNFSIYFDRRFWLSSTPMAPNANCSTNNSSWRKLQ